MPKAVQNFVHKLLTLGGFVKNCFAAWFLCPHFAQLLRQYLHNFKSQNLSIKFNFFTLSTPLIITTKLINLN